MKPENDEVNLILNDTIKNCGKNHFHSFDNICVYDNKFKEVENNEEFILTVIIVSMKFESHFFESLKNVKNGMENGFRFSEIVKLTIKVEKLIQVYQMWA